jgi:hypothetical protein
MLIYLPELLVWKLKSGAISESGFSEALMLKQKFQDTAAASSGCISQLPNLSSSFDVSSPPFLSQSARESHSWH